MCSLISSLYSLFVAFSFFLLHSLCNFTAWLRTEISWPMGASWLTGFSSLDITTTEKWRIPCLQHRGSHLHLLRYVYPMHWIAATLFDSFIFFFSCHAVNRLIDHEPIFSTVHDVNLIADHNTLIMSTLSLATPVIRIPNLKNLSAKAYNMSLIVLCPIWFGDFINAWNMSIIK